jgi:hypothetical protein
MGNVAGLQLSFDLQQVRFVARRESDGVAVRGFRGAARRGYSLGVRVCAREISSDDDVVPERLSALVRTSCAYSNAAGTSVNQEDGHEADHL